ncbi:hypothetical protein T484DRAFT_1767139 [Baffinella frigidus]|nr:hypothetical protein T484DRAFT_1767139 [Cryptophyta sp. CCMP2293]
MDLQTGETKGRWDAPEHWFVVSEPTFVPKKGSSPGNGDQGYLLVWITRPLNAAGTHVRGGDAPLHDPEIADESDRPSRLMILDAASLAPPSSSDSISPLRSGEVLGAGAVAAVALPGSVPYGLHSAWLPFDELPVRK